MEDLGQPSSYLVLADGVPVYSSDGKELGRVEHVLDVPEDDIFDGLAVSVGKSASLRYVPGERVGLISPGKVAVRFAGADVHQLEAFEAPKPVTVWRPSAPSLGTRLTNWMRGKR